MSNAECEAALKGENERLRSGLIECEAALERIVAIAQIRLFSLRALLAARSECACGHTFAAHRPGRQDCCERCACDTYRAASAPPESAQGKRPEIVCICGSTRFAETMNREGARLTLEGAIVVRPEVVTYSSATDPQRVQPDVKAALDELHKRKIDLADSVFVVNVGGYIGESTRGEIAYAERTGKLIEFLEPAFLVLPLEPKEEP